MSREEKIRIIRMPIFELREYCKANKDNEFANWLLEERVRHEMIFQLLFD